MSLFDKWKKKDTSSKMTEGWDAIVEVYIITNYFYIL